MTVAHRCLFLSDLHLGTRRCRAKTLLQLLQRHPSERLVLVGDILDFSAWQQRPARFSQAELQLLSYFWQRQLNGELIWLLGNHENPLRQFGGAWLQQQQHWIREELVYTSLHGQRLLVLHGDQLPFGGLSFNHLELFALRGLGVLERLHRYLCLPLPSPSALMLGSWMGRKLVSNFHAVQESWAKQQQWDGIICGHIHGALLEKRQSCLVVNTGCWTHAPGTAVAETAAGDWLLLDGRGGQSSVRVSQCQMSSAAGRCC
jgi:UDP-2,3-diacylglucosamine pyrophosphatase LpxH